MLTQWAKWRIKGDRMAEFRDVAKAYKRLCDAFGTCADCPLSDLAEETACACASGVTQYYPEEAERIIMDWAKENPLITNGMKFREVFGINLDSIEVVCRDGEGKVSHHQDVSAWLDKEYKGKDGQDDH